MSDKTDLIFNLVSKMETRQTEKLIADAERHAKEDAWREAVDKILGKHSKSLATQDKRLNILEKPTKVLEFLTSRSGRIGSIMLALLSAVGILYRMIS